MNDEIKGNNAAIIIIEIRRVMSRVCELNTERRWIYESCKYNRKEMCFWRSKDPFIIYGVLFELYVLYMIRSGRIVRTHVSTRSEINKVVEEVAFKKN